MAAYSCTSRVSRFPNICCQLAWALLIGGIAFVRVKRALQGRPSTDTVTWTVAVLVAVGQLIAAVFPGTSRSGATILIMLLLGVSRPAATEFSFLVGIPAMLAAGSLKIWAALLHPAADAMLEDWGMVLVGFMVSAIVSFLVVG